jgi:hypothetical protein
MEPYENQLIGAFLYAFGYSAATRANAKGAFGEVMPVNLLQQTPLDTAFGDLIVGSDRCVLIEFKRTAKELGTEPKKWSKNDLDTFFEDKAMLQLSARAHVVVYGARRNNTLELRSCQYLDLLGAFKQCSLDRRSGLELIDELFATLGSTSRRHGVSSGEIARYLAFLAKVRKQQTSQGGRKIADGAWVGVAEKNGQLVLQSAASLEMLLDLALEHSHEKNRDLDLDRGFGL